MLDILKKKFDSYCNRCESDNTVTDFESLVSIDNKATTNFIESAAEVIGTSSQSTHTVSAYIEADADIKSFMLRPVLLTNGAWTTASAENTNLVTSSISSYFGSVPMWAEKIKGFNLIRGDFMLKVQINASPFHQGKLLLHYLPAYNQFLTTNPSYGKFKNKHMTQKIQHPHVEIDCRTTSITMRIPYVAPTAWFPRKEAFYDWGTWFLDVFSPLLTGPAAPVGQAYVDYLVYGWWENIELNAPTVPQSDNSMSRMSKGKKKIRGGQSQETAEGQGPIATGLKKVAKIANILDDVPIINEVAAPVEWAANILGGFASSLGWSKPRELDGSTNVYQQLVRYAGTSDGPDTAYPGGVSVLNRLETIDYGSYTNEDEMSLAFLYKVPYYRGAFNWASGAGQGTVLINQLIGPLEILNGATDVVGAHTVGYYYNNPMTYLAQIHTFWRGSINVTLKFVKTQMHSGRLEVVWTPVNNYSTDPTLTTSSFNKRAIIDIRTEDTVTFELPYLLSHDYIPTFSNTTNFSDYSGKFKITVLNDVRAPESCAQSINVQIFYTAGKDFELAVPGKSVTSPVPYQPQSDGEVLMIGSNDQGSVMAEMEIGSKNTTNDEMFHCKRCIGEKVLSIKTWLLRNSVILSPSTSGIDLTATNKLVIDPWFIGVSKMEAGTGNLLASDFLGDAYSWMAPMYAFARGSMRMTFIDADPSQTLFTNVMPEFVKPSPAINPWRNVLTSLNNWWSKISPVTPGSYQYILEPMNFIENSPVTYQMVPYYNKYPYHLNTYYTGDLTDDASTNVSLPSSSLFIGGKVSQNFGTDLNIQRSVADDFQLMFFTGAPCTSILYV